jgi:hypothetical protein
MGDWQLVAVGTTIEPTCLGDDFHGATVSHRSSIHPARPVTVRIFHSDECAVHETDFKDTNPSPRLARTFLLDRVGEYIVLPAHHPAVDLTGLAAYGLTGMVNLIGEALAPDQSVWRRTFWGTGLLSLACALPVAGWFLLLPYILVSGVGAVILGFFQRDTS